MVFNLERRTGVIYTSVLYTTIVKYFVVDTEVVEIYPSIGVIIIVVSST